jgi:16S rRNA (adenine1518-N6/adenine1519-N6)-dimethyltransferase
MNLANLSELKNFLHQHNFRPKDYMGQNFLVDEDALNEIVRAGDLKPSDVVLEVGPGLGVLTKELVARAEKVIAVEKDEKLVRVLQSEIRNPKLVLINQDILRFNLDEHITGPYKVVANIPYYLTSKLIQYFLEQKNQPELLVLMIQKEVGERITAQPGELSILAISVQIYSDPEIVSFVSKQSFWPVPEVDSVILKITPKDKYGSQITDYRSFFRVIKTAFAGKRKQIKNTIKNTEALEKAGIDPTLRPQDLKIEQWIELYKNY